MHSPTPSENLCMRWLPSFSTRHVARVIPCPAGDIFFTVKKLHFPRAFLRIAHREFPVV